MTEQIKCRPTPERVLDYERRLREEDHAAGTIRKYLRDLNAFAAWLGERPVDRETTLEWREHLLATGHAPGTVNSMLSALNGYLEFLGAGYKVKFLKIQRRTFRDPERELSRKEYMALVQTARAWGQERLALLMETICSTGIRVGEVKYITVEAARRGRAVISLKGKIRVIMLTEKLCRKLLKYAKKQKIGFGELFITKTGRSLSERQIWGEMKRLCAAAGVPPRKVFPHNLRHLFAQRFYQSCGDIVKLADVLGHSSIETTRIYLMTTGTEHRKQLERLRLIF